MPFAPTPQRCSLVTSLHWRPPPPEPDAGPRSGEKRRGEASNTSSAHTVSSHLSVTSQCPSPAVALPRARRCKAKPRQIDARRSRSLSAGQGRIVCAQSVAALSKAARGVGVGGARAPLVLCNPGPFSSFCILHEARTPLLPTLSTLAPPTTHSLRTHLPPFVLVTRVCSTARGEREKGEGGRASRCLSASCSLARSAAAQHGTHGTVHFELRDGPLLVLSQPVYLCDMCVWLLFSDHESDTKQWEGR